MKENLMKDIEFLHLGKNGNIEFAQFANSENQGRKMKNDVIFLKTMLNAKEEDEFRLKSEITDELGITHKKFQQYYKGIKVDNAEYVLHWKNNNIDVMNGDFQNISIPNVEPVINEPQALTKALEYVGAKIYIWEDSDMEKFLKQHLNDQNATYYPKGELVIAKDYLKGSNSHKLSWKFTVSSLEPRNEQLIFVDAVNGEIINDVSLILRSNTNGSADTMYSGTQNITCDSYLGNYRLYEIRATTQGNSAMIHTRNTNGRAEFLNTNTNWKSGSWATFSLHQHALDAHWG